jgi:hypothetical protein
MWQSRRRHAKVCNNDNWEQAMSIYTVNYLCREVLRDHAFRAP